MKKCKLCGADAVALVRCHIYPVSMFWEMSEHERPLPAIKQTGGPFVAEAKSGFYDEEIVCQSCETRFHTADDAAINFRRDALYLRKRVWAMEAANPRSLEFLTLNADPALLHQFALQSWLRATLSDRTDFKDAQPGWVSRHAAHCILSGLPTLTSDCPEVAYCIFRDDNSAVMATPVVSESGQHPFILMQFPYMVVLIATTEAGLPPGFQNLVLKHGTDVSFRRTRHYIDEAIARRNEMIEQLDGRFEFLARRSLIPK